MSRERKKKKRKKLRQQKMHHKMFVKEAGMSRKTHYHATEHHNNNNVTDLARIWDPQTTDHVELVDEGVQVNPLLYRLFTTGTPHGMEHKLHAHLPFLKRNDLSIDMDEKGNIWVEIGKQGVDYNTLFSCHTDTVLNENIAKEHQIELFLSREVKNRQDKIILKAGMMYAGYYAPDKDGVSTARPCVLGGDDKVGVYILCKLIENNVPGRYIFHVGEERGCIGSHFISETKSLYERIEKLHHAIAFDRKDYGDIIHTQRGAECCSKEFMNKLAEELNKYMPPYQKFSGGVVGAYTDTANYKYHIPECTNISVGYFDAHGANEHVDLVWIENTLVPALIKLGTDGVFEKLPAARSKEKPIVQVHQSYGNNRNYHNTRHRVSFAMIDDNTPDWELPEWNFPDGYKIECTRSQMVKLINNKLGSCYYGAEKKNTAEQLAQILADNYNLSTEVITLRNLVARGVQPGTVTLMRALRNTDYLVRQWMAAHADGKTIKVNTKQLALLPEELAERKRASEMVKAAVKYRRMALDIRMTYQPDAEMKTKLAESIVELAFRAMEYRTATPQLTKACNALVKFIGEHKDKDEKFAAFVGLLNEDQTAIANKPEKVN